MQIEKSAEARQPQKEFVAQCKTRATARNSGPQTEAPRRRVLESAINRAMRVDKEAVVFAEV
jgi:hypothetical protein